MNNFYIYSHIKKTDGKCFYIGKGSGNRAFTTYSRNRHWKKIVNECGFTPIILVSGISEKKAFDLESEFCRQVGYDNLTNIRKENGWGGHSHQPETILKLSKSVLQYDMDGNFIKEWESATLAAQHLNKSYGSAITECCRGYISNIYGYIWRHSDNPLPLPPKFVKRKNKVHHPPYYNPIDQYDMDRNFIKTWNNTKEAMIALNVKGISQCISGKYKSSGGFIWKKASKK
jgi:hypothetical protein